MVSGSNEEISMRVIIDAETCIGCSACEDICPEVFEMTDDDKAIVKLDEIPANLEDACREAADACPVEAISIEE
jgi:ferredoxin